MKTYLNPKIEIFNPYNQPFASSMNVGDDNVRSIVNSEVMQYMKSDHKGLAISAKNTPCQCCACR